MKNKKYKRVMTIAGSDSGGGAGIQADLKTISALGCYGMSAITALTAQNTVTVRAIHEIPIQMIRQQLEAILDDIGVDAVKIGMLATPEVIVEIAAVLKKYQLKKIVLDPVMVAKSGDRLLQNNAVHTLKTSLLPMATIVTPNLPEAEVLSDQNVNSREDMERAGKILLKTGASAILIKGGHSEGAMSEDCLILDDRSPIWYKTERIQTNNTHGTGCTLSSAIAAFIARGYTTEEAVASAKKYISAAIEAGSYYTIGNGHGPVHHFYNFWE